MSEAPSNPEPQATPSDPERGLVARGLARFLTEWRKEWVDPTEAIVTADRSSTEVNKATAQYSLATGPDMRLKFPGDLQEINDNHKGDLRPVTRHERKTVKKIEKALISNVRKAGVLQDIHAIYDIPDPSYTAPSIPDRNPRIGNSEVRAAVDESLRRAGLLSDQPPQPAAPKLHIGTPEYNQAIANQPISEKRRKGIDKAVKLVNKFNKKADKNVSYVRGIAGDTDQSVATIDPTSVINDEPEPSVIHMNTQNNLIGLEPTIIKETLEQRVIARLLGDERRENEDAEAQLKRIQKTILSEAVAGLSTKEKQKIITAVESKHPISDTRETNPGEVNKLSELIEAVEAIKARAAEPKVTKISRAEWAAERRKSSKKQTGALADPHKSLKRSLNPPNYME